MLTSPACCAEMPMATHPLTPYTMSSDEATYASYGKSMLVPERTMQYRNHEGRPHRCACVLMYDVQRSPLDCALSSTTSLYCSESAPCGIATTSVVFYTPPVSPLCTVSIEPLHSGLQPVLAVDAAILACSLPQRDDSRYQGLNALCLLHFREENHAAAYYSFPK